MEIRPTVCSRNEDVEFSLLLSYESMGYMQLKSVSKKGFRSLLINVGLNSMRHTQFKSTINIRTGVPAALYTEPHGVQSHDSKRKTGKLKKLYNIPNTPLVIKTFQMYFI